ncbi:hsp90-like protein [Podospora didyma]|uniref:histidine kinase n=1 Tax=Podospora didyma TaxID=330526 RepID=A0AAE0P8J8_9PEZI|nr:hsp90-like protein [Podospora didyma]
MTTANPPPLSETARERETFKYDDLGISTAALRSSPIDSSLKPIPTAVLSSTPDPGLTAFAQLGLYRLDAARSMVSLFDRTYQHFVAEAVRCSPLCKESEALSDGQAAFCGTAIPRIGSLCEHVLIGPAEFASVPGTPYGYKPSSLPVSVIPNVPLDPRFRHIRDDRRFYAGVPIRSPTGINIGVYCVIDDKPRPEGLTDDQIQFVRDISKTMMDYLEAKRSSEWYRREERMVRGLGSFVEGHATLSNWSDSPNRAFFYDIPGVREGILNKKLQAAPPDTSPKSCPHGINPELTGESVDCVDPIPTPIPVLPPALEFRPRPRRATESASHFTSADQLQDDVERVFSKAANVIRESVEVEGVLFLDASVRSFGGMIGREISEPPILTKLSSAESSSDEGAPPVPGDTDVDDCNVLGFSTSSRSSINGDQPVHAHAAMSERLLHRLVQRYPHGCIFNFEADGSMLDQSNQDGEECFDTSPQWKRSFLIGEEQRGHDLRSKGSSQRLRRRRDTAASLLKMFPNARSVAFVPLFDGQKSRWFAGGFVWTKTPTRIFTVKNELSYLRVFGLTTMAEVARLNTKAADRTKTDILGSISHELRSPLHGVVGAVDLLRNTMLDRAQENILRTIETSGRTLLDTIDHLLDYSRISSNMRSSRSDRRNTAPFSRRNSKSPTITTLSTTDMHVQLDRLAEEVVESVLAGWSYRNMSDAHFAAWNSFMQGSQAGTRHHTPTGSDLDHVGTPSLVQIYLDIDPSVDWSFRVHPGAFRRIVMNLVGNSLKFTTSGFIRITLRQELYSNSQQCPSEKRVILTVSDSGKGIGQDYLRHHLFTPFSQEDQFAPGTGLGLSLVRQMAITLGGNIDVASQVGQGTTITVSLPLPQSQAGDQDEPTFDQNYKSLAGYSVCLRGFDSAIKIREGFHREDTKQKSPLKLIESICRDWLHMKIVPEPDTSVETPDFVVCREQHSTSVGDESKADFTRCPHVFIRVDSSNKHDLSKPKHCSSQGSLSCLTQPIGPRKLAEALLASRVRFNDDLDAMTSAAAPVLDQSEQPARSAMSSPGDVFINPMLDQTPLKPTSHTTDDHSLKRPPLISDKKMSVKGDDLKDGHEVLLPSLLPKPVVVPTSDGLVSAVSQAPDPRPKILIVDDNAINLKILAAYMIKLGQPHSTATNGLEAVEIFTKSPSEYSCILTDISMPVMDGLESTRHIREFERDRKLKPTVVIALTGLSGADIQQDAFVSGVDLFLTRPLVLKGLVKALESTGVRGTG